MTGVELLHEGAKILSRVAFR